MKNYKIATLILSALVVIETILLIFLWVSWPKKIVKVPLPPLKGKIAIVLDDWGYNLHNLTILDEVKYPLTISVLPNLNYSKTLSEELYQRGFEIILHLPMEPMPQEKYRLEKNTIMTSMNEATIISVIEQDLISVAHARGVSNHMGSKITQDPRAMGIIFKELKKRGLYFLDSLVSSKSICFALANKMQLGFVKRDIFLDNKEEPEYIKKQIYKLKSKARAYGQAIGIGHDRKITLVVLKELMPQLEKEGYKFVFVSELVK